MLLGCLLNAAAIAEEALALCVRTASPLSIVCAGIEGTRIPSLDDAYTAGAIVARVARAAARPGFKIELSDAARMAQLVADAAESPQRVLADSTTGEVMRRADSGDDIAFCARVDVRSIVPVLVRDQSEARWPVRLL